MSSLPIARLELERSVQRLERAPIVPQYVPACSEEKPSPGVPGLPGAHGLEQRRRIG